MNANKCIRVRRCWKRVVGDAVASSLAQCFFGFGSPISLITKVNPPPPTRPKHHLIPPKVPKACEVEGDLPPLLLIGLELAGTGSMAQWKNEQTNSL